MTFCSILRLKKTLAKYQNIKTKTNDSEKKMANTPTRLYIMNAMYPPEC